MLDIKIATVQLVSVLPLPVLMALILQFAQMLLVCSVTPTVIVLSVTILIQILPAQLIRLVAQLLEIANKLTVTQLKINTKILIAKILELFVL
jgi:hypothetical protein